MALDANIVGGSSTAGKQNVDASYNALVLTPGVTAGGVTFGGGAHHGHTNQSENDSGEMTGFREARSPEVDDDYRLRVSHDTLVDQEGFYDTAQNTGKFTYTIATLTMTGSTAGLRTNALSVTTTTTGCTLGTHAQFPHGGTKSLICETSLAFTAQPNANTTIDFGMFQRGVTTAYVPLDGMYFRMNSAGLQGIVNNNGTEVSTGVFPLALGSGTYLYTNDTVYRFLIQSTNIRTTFWINNLKMGEVLAQSSSDAACLSRALPWSIRHGITGGAAGLVTQALVKGYRVYLRGPQFADKMGTIMNRHWGSYQGLSGGTMGSLASLANSSSPAAATGNNTTLAANLPNGLGGLGVATALATAATDMIYGSYQVPAGSATVQGRRLVIRGVKLDAVNTGAAVATTASIIQWTLAFGATSLDLATANTASFATNTTKAPRRVSIGFTSWIVAAAIGAAPTQGSLILDVSDAPIYVNPGEFVVLVGKWVLGTLTGSQTITYTWTPIYTWE